MAFKLGKMEDLFMAYADQAKKFFIPEGISSSFEMNDLDFNGRSWWVGRGKKSALNYLSN